MNNEYFNMMKNIIYLDAEKFLNSKNKVLDSDLNSKIGFWELENGYSGTIRVVTNFSGISDYKKLDEFVFNSMLNRLLPDFSEIAKLEKIPARWITKTCNSLSCLKKNFYSDSSQFTIDEMLKILDEKLDYEEDEKISLKINVYPEDKEYYIKVRDSLDVRNLKKFKFPYGVYLNEVWDLKDNLDAIAIVNHLLDKVKVDEKYRHIFVDSINIQNIIEPENYKLLVITAYKNGIYVDMSFASYNDYFNVYRKVYGSILNLSSKDTVRQSLEDIIKLNGNSFYFTQNLVNIYEGSIKSLDSDFVYLEFLQNIEDNLKKLIEPLIKEEKDIAVKYAKGKSILRLPLKRIKDLQFLLIPKSYVLEGDELPGKLTKIKFYE